MVLDVTLCSTEGFGIWRSAAGGGWHVTLIDPLGDQGATRLLEELVVKPVHKAPHLDPRGVFGRQQATLPDPLLDEFCRQTVFLEHEADETGMWTNRIVEQRQHCAASLASDLAEKSALPHDLSRIVLTKK